MSNSTLNVCNIHSGLKQCKNYKNRLRLTRVTVDTVTFYNSRCFSTCISVKPSNDSISQALQTSTKIAIEQGG